MEGRNAGREGGCGARGGVGGTVTYFLHGGVGRQEALLEKLLPRFLVIHLDLRHHVARHVSHAASRLTTIEAVRIFVAVHLERRQQVGGAVSLRGG